MLVIYFVLSRLFLFLCSSIAQKTVPYLGFFPYKELLVEYNLPPWVSAFANFDGIHYLLIAKQGYSQWEQAFFPLYPLLIKIVSFIIPNYLVASLLISHISFTIGLIFFNKLLKVWGIKTSWPLLFLLSFPTAFFFGVVYTEGLFFMLFILSLYFLHKKHYWLAGICAALSSLTRLIGIFLVIPFFFSLLVENKPTLKRFALLVTRHAPLLLSPFLGLFSYMSYLWLTTGDPLFFFNSQPLFGANRSTHLILLPQVYYRYIKILFTATHDFQWHQSIFEMGVFSFVFFIVILNLFQDLKNKEMPKQVRHDRLGLGLFSLINILLPTLTGTFSSIPRYALFSISLFLYLSQIKSRAIKICIFLVFLTLQIVLLSLFIQGYFVG